MPPLDPTDRTTSVDSRAGIIGRLEQHARTARRYAIDGKPLPALDAELFFKALADAGDYNRLNPEDRIPSLDPVTCRCGGADTNPTQELGAPVRVA